MPPNMPSTRTWTNSGGQGDMVIGMLSKGQVYPPHLPAAIYRELQAWHLVPVLSNFLIEQTVVELTTSLA